MFRWIICSEERIKKNKGFSCIDAPKTFFVLYKGYEKDIFCSLLLGFELKRKITPKACVADLDARWFCRGYSNPLAMMGVALDRYLPGRNAILATKSYVKLI